MSAPSNAETILPRPRAFGVADPPALPIDPPVPISRYRADIDGLRAIAVLAVILVHVGVRGVSGGYLGVDVFFVISGFLIYRDLTGRMERDSFSLVGFYGRRLRRTLPALYVVTAITLAAAALIAMPGDLDEIARSAIAAVLFVPNIFYLTRVGYFDDSTNTKPLLHTWSLGVEEQFYLLAPFLPLLLRRLAPRARRIVFFALLLAAVAGTAVYRLHWQQSAFYLMPTRAFEFLIGAALVEGLVPAVRARWLAEALTAGAVVALALSFHLFYHASPLPGLLSLVPCLAAAAIIHVGTTTRTFVGGVLSSPIFVVLGLISYSLYLWHWPILVLARYADIAQTPRTLGLEALVLLAVSLLTWRWVERPFRDAGSPLRRRAPILIPLGAATLAGAAVLAIAAIPVLSSRFPPDVASVASWYDFGRHKPFRQGTCFITSQERVSDFDRDACLTTKLGRNVLIVGDSHAAHLWSGLRDAWPGVHFLQATASGCKPLVGTGGEDRCIQVRDEAFDRFLPNHRVDAIVISALWETDDIEPLTRTIAALKPFADRIVVLGPIPSYDVPVATLIAKAMLRHDLESVAAHRAAWTENLDADMKDAVAPLATYVALNELMSKTTAQLFAAPGIPMQFDYSHLTPPGAAVLMRAVRAQQPDLFGAAQRSTSSR